MQNGFAINALRSAWHDDEGVLTFEWVLLLTLVVIGIVAGLTAARDAIIDELGDMAIATVNLDQTYVVAPFTDDCGGGITAPGYSFTDSVPTITECGRGGPAGQTP